MSNSEPKVLHPKTYQRLIRIGEDAAVAIARRKKRDEQIIGLHMAGLGITEIAKEVGLSKQRVSQIIIKLMGEKK